MNKHLAIGLLAACPSQVAEPIAITFLEVLDSGVPPRIGAIADEITRTNPHLLGLQEVSLVRYQSPR